MKTAVYGGSFDPVHLGHKALALRLAGELGIDRVFIIPAKVSPFKTRTFVSDEDRLNMCRLTFYEPLFDVLDIEIRRDGKSYTVDTLEQLKAAFPDDEFFLFMGEDMFLSLERWYKYERILELSKPVAACRFEDRSALEKMKEYAANRLGLAENEYFISDIEPVEVSSTKIRNCFKNGTVPEGLDERVLHYIKERGLYSDEHR